MGLGAEWVPIAKITAFLMSLTSRDSSFLLRSAISRKGHNFSILEEWEKDVHFHEDELHVKFHGATPIGKDAEAEGDPLKKIQLLGDLFEKKIANYAGAQTQKEGMDNGERSY